MIFMDIPPPIAYCLQLSGSKLRATPAEMEKSYYY
jgi:hypothetical protein